MAILGDSTITTIATTEIKVGSNNDGTQLVLKDKVSLLDLIYPVGSIYVYQDGTAAPKECPIQDTLGGTWEKIENRFLYSSSGESFYGKTAGSNKAYLVFHKHEVENNYFSGYTSEAGEHTHGFINSLPNWHIDKGNKNINGKVEGFLISLKTDGATLVPEASSYKGINDHPVLEEHEAHRHKVTLESGALTGKTTENITTSGGISPMGTERQLDNANMPQYFGVIA